MMVYLNHADGMVSGAVHTTQHTIRPAFQIIKTKPGVSIVSSVFFMCLEDRVLVYGDCAINPNPDAQELADIAVSAAQTAMMYNISPRVAMLSYSTGESGMIQMYHHGSKITNVGHNIISHIISDTFLFSELKVRFGIKLAQLRFKGIYDDNIVQLQT
jgi:phosphate acetyltransferase